MIKCCGLNVIKCLELYSYHCREITKTIRRSRLQRKIDLQYHKMYPSKKPSHHKLDSFPSTIYTKYYSELRKEFNIKAIANITGGGLWNIPRISDEFDYRINYLPAYDEIPYEFQVIAERSKSSRVELYKTFNMGIGIVLALPAEEADAFLKKSLAFYKSWKIGKLEKGSGKIIF